jgi:hypothetical protein
LKAAIPARLGHEVALRFLAIGNSSPSLALLIRIPPCTISRILPETLKSIFDALDSFVKLRMAKLLLHYYLIPYSKKGESV